MLATLFRLRVLASNRIFASGLVHEGVSKDKRRVEAGPTRRRDRARATGMARGEKYRAGEDAAASAKRQAGALEAKVGIVESLRAEPSRVDTSAGRGRIYRSLPMPSGLRPVDVQEMAEEVEKFLRPEKVAVCPF